MLFQVDSTNESSALVWYEKINAERLVARGSWLVASCHRAIVIVAHGSWLIGGILRRPPCCDRGSCEKSQVFGMGLSAGVRVWNSSDLRTAFGARRSKTRNETVETRKAHAMCQCVERWFIEQELLSKAAWVLSELFCAARCSFYRQYV